MCCGDPVAVTATERKVTVTFTPTADSGTEANAAFKPLVASVLPITNFFGESGGQVVIEQITVRELAGSALKRNPLTILVYDGSTTPATPAIDTAYSAAATGLQALFMVNAGSAAAATPNQGYRDISSTKAEATIKPQERVKSEATNNTTANIIVLFTSAGTVYSVGTDSIEIDFWVRDLIQC